MDEMTIDVLVREGYKRVCDYAFDCVLLAKGNDRVLYNRKNDNIELFYHKYENILEQKEKVK